MLSNQNLIYGGIAGAVIGILVALGQAWWNSDNSMLGAVQLISFAIVGAIGGILAFGLRGSLGEDDK